MKRSVLDEHDIGFHDPTLLEVGLTNLRVKGGTCSDIGTEPEVVCFNF